MEDIGNLAHRPFEDNEETNGTVDNVHHYHAHGEGCEDMGHVLKKEHGYPKQDNEKDKENMGEHSYPQEDEKEERGDHEGKYPGFIRKMR